MGGDEHLAVAMLGPEIDQKCRLKAMNVLSQGETASGACLKVTYESLALQQCVLYDFLVQATQSTRDRQKKQFPSSLFSEPVSV